MGALILGGFLAYAHETNLITGTVVKPAEAATSAAAAKPATLTVENGWSRATPAGSAVAAGFMTIVNKGPADRLLSVTSDIGRVEIHQMQMYYGVMKMRQINSLLINSNATVELRPGGLHLMFMNLKAPLAEGQTIKARLKFKYAGDMDVEFAVKPAGSTQLHTH